MSVRLNTNRVRGTPCGIPHSITDRILNIILGSLADQTTKRAFGIAGGCVNKNTIHSVLIIGLLTINSFPNRRTAVTTFKTKLVNDQMCKSVNQDKLRTEISNGICSKLGIPIRILKVTQSGLNSRLLCPFIHRFLVELKENTFTMNLNGRKPVFTAKSEHFLSFRNRHLIGLCT